MRYIIHILILLFPSVIWSQEILTIREVFDFNINDEFHFTDNEGYRPPNARRIKVLDKFLSTNLDTISYKLFYDVYSSEYNSQLDRLVYNFDTLTDIVIYANLDSSIYTYYTDLSYNKLLENQLADSLYSFDYDSINLLNQELCDVRTNGYDIQIGEFEPSFYHIEFSKGLGETFNELIEGSSGSDHPLFSNRLFYYKKGEITCGIPDNRTNTGFTNTFSLKDIKIYPNPTSEFLNIQIQKPISNLVIGIIDSSGKKILTTKFTNEDNGIDISDLTPGIYILTCITENEIHNFRIFKY